MPSPYRMPKTFKLKPYQSKARGRERVVTGALLVLFAIFNLYMMSIDGFISLLFALFFGWSGLKNIALGLRLSQLPERERAYRISTHGLFKILEGRELARLNLNEIKAMWLNDDQSKLSLMTHRGVETIAKEELAEEEQWETFTTWVERSVTTVVYQVDPRLWNEIQTQSESMAQLGKRRLLGSIMMIFALLIGAGTFFYYSWDHVPFFLQTESSDLVLMSLGAINAEQFSVENLYRLFASLILPGPSLSLLFNLFTLYWVARPLEQLWGTRWLLMVYGSGYLVGLSTFMYLTANQFFIGAQCSSLALCIAAYTYYTQLKAGTHLNSPPLILKKASSAAFILGFVFVLGQGFERSPSYALESAWITTAIVGILLGHFIAQKSISEHTWVLSHGEKWSTPLSVLCAALPVASVLFAFVNHVDPIKVSHEQQLSPYSSNALIELAQRCSGIPLQELSPLNVEVIEALPTPQACTKETRLLIQQSLQRLSGFYPKLSEESNKTQLKAHPISPGVKTLYRTLAIQSFDTLTPKELSNRLSQQAIRDPQDIYGDLLAAFYANDTELGRSHQTGQKRSSLKLKVQSHNLDLKLNRGQLTWNWDFVAPPSSTNLDAKDSSQKLKNAKLKGYSDILWFKVYNQKNEVSKILMMSFPNHFNSSKHKEISRRKRLGSPKQAQSIQLIQHERRVTQYKSLMGERVRSYSWPVPKLIKAWANDQIQKTSLESNKSNQ